MTRPSRPAASLLRALMLALTLAGTLAMPAVAADSIQLEARALLGGRFEASGWVAVSVNLTNDGAPVSGYLSVDSQDGIVRRFVELPGGARKQVAIYLRPSSFTRTIELRFEDANGTSLATASAEVRVLERTSGHVAVVGDPAGMLRPQLIARGGGFPSPIAVTASDFPERPEPLRGIETIVWAADSTGLTEAQRRSLERWIASGGQLVVLGGPDWQARVAAFEALLPVESLAAVDGTDLSPLAAWAGAPLPEGTAVATAALGSPRQGAIVLARTPADELLAAATTIGAGRVTWLAVDLATAPFQTWEGAGLFWTRLLPDDRLIQQFVGGIVDEEVANILTQALGSLPALDVPPAELLLAVIVGYILLIGPLNYAILRRLDRRDLAWVTAPLLVVIFSAASYGIGVSLKGSDIIVNQIAVVRTTLGGTAATVSTYAGIFSPTRATYDLTVRGEALLSPLVYGFDPSFSAVPQYVTEQGDPSHLRGLAVSVFGLQAIRADAVVEYQPSLYVEWSSGEDGVEGRVTNQGTAPIEDVAIISRSGGLMIGTLEPSEAKTFLFSYSNLNGSSAADQVYGSAVWDTTTEAQRTVLVRRQVIDSLVGYGGWAGRPDTSIGIDRGPFVIGWHADAAPVDVEVDGHAVQRYSQAVEVLSGRPALGPGSVRLAASQLTSEAIELVGEANQSEPGYVTLANGEVTYRVSLPLEATGIIPTRIALIAGNDPGMIFYDQQNLGSLLPRGYRMAVYDVVAGEWQDVGDLSQRSRFEIEDPARIVDAGGRILVRIVGSDIPAGQGETSVFASAIVEGIIDR